MIFEKAFFYKISLQELWAEIYGNSKMQALTKNF
jgi:hypothetical protein